MILLCANPPPLLTHTHAHIHKILQCLFFDDEIPLRMSGYRITAGYVREAEHAGRGVGVMQRAL